MSFQKAILYSFTIFSLQQIFFRPKRTRIFLDLPTCCYRYSKYCLIWKNQTRHIIVYSHELITIFDSLLATGFYLFKHPYADKANKSPNIKRLLSLLSNHVNGSLGLVPYQTYIVLHLCVLVDRLTSRSFSGTPICLLAVVIRNFRHGYTMLRLQCVSLALTMTNEAVVFNYGHAQF